MFSTFTGIQSVQKFIRPFDCGCGNCTSFSILSSDCPKPIKDDQVPIFSLHPDHGLANNLNDHKKWKLHCQTREISKKFKKILRRTLRHLQAKQVSVNDVIGIVTTSIQTPITLQCKSYSELLEVLAGKVSWFHHEVMLDVVDECLPESPEIKRMWTTYTDELRTYANDRIVKYEGVEFCLPPLDGEQTIALIAMDREYDMKLRHIPDLREALCDILGLSNLFFYTVRCSSIILGFVISLASRKNFQLSQDQLRKLAKLDIISLHVEDNHVYPQLVEWSHWIGHNIILGN